MIKVNYRSDSCRLAAEVECVLPGFWHPTQIHGENAVFFLFVERRSLSYGDPIVGLEKATVNWPTVGAMAVEGATVFAAALLTAVTVAQELDGAYRKYQVTVRLKDGSETALKLLANNEDQIYRQFQASGFEVVEIQEVEEGS